MSRVIKEIPIENESSGFATRGSRRGATAGGSTTMSSKGSKVQARAASSGPETHEGSHPASPETDDADDRHVVPAHEPQRGRRQANQGQRGKNETGRGR